MTSFQTIFVDEYLPRVTRRGQDGGDGAGEVRLQSWKRVRHVRRLSGRVSYRSRVTASVGIGVGPWRQRVWNSLDQDQGQLIETWLHYVDSSI